jgi:hypothetical protein
LKTIEPKRWSRLGSGNHVASGIWLDEAVSLNQTLYRYVQWEPYGKKHLDDGKLYFASPERWPDPYERWWCDELFRVGSKLATVSAYAMCMTTSWGDEPYWRMYDHSGTVPVVRFTTTVGRLVNVLSDYVESRAAKAYLGKVMYHPSADLQREAARLRQLGADAQLARHVAHALMLKRTAFTFESEHRAVLLDRSGKQEARFLNFTPSELYTSVMIGPSVKAPEERAIRAALVDHGFLEDRVRCSSIYRFPSLKR